MSDYLVRFDDICPAMNWRVWKEIEAILIEYDVKPILAVVPQNKDAKLIVDSPREDFWERVRAWQARGWTIGLHGYEHVYVTAEPGIIGVGNQSEFAGLSEAEQERKLTAATGIFRKEKVIPDIWVAPSHSFDTVTVRVLERLGIDCISDGFALKPYVDPAGVAWIPQQMWRFRKMPFGVWTVCFHHNDWREKEIESFRNCIRRFRREITEVAAVRSRFAKRKQGLLDRISIRGAGLLLKVKARGKIPKRIPKVP